MSDLKDSTVTFTEAYSPFEDLSDIGSSGVDGLPMIPQDPYAYVEAALQASPSPDYVPSPEHPPSPAYVPGFVPEPVYPEFMPPEDDVLPAKEQPLPVAEDEEDPEEDPADYPTDRKDDEKEEESSGDDANDEEEDEDEDEDEEEHPTLTDSVSPPVHRVTARMYVRAQTPISLLSETKIRSPPLPISPPPLPASRTYSLGYRAAMITLRAESPSTFHPLPSSTSPLGTPPLLPILLPTSSPPLLLPSTSHRADVLEVTLPPRKRLCIALGPRFNVDDSSSALTTRPIRGFRADYATTDVTELSQRMTDFVTTVRQGIDKIYRRLDDIHDYRLLMSGQLNMLRRDRHAHAHTTKLIESEARLFRETWVQSMDASDTARAERQQGPAKGPAHPEKMAPKKTTRSTPATTTTTTTTYVTNAQLKALIDQGVADALVARDAERSRNNKDNHESGMGVRKQAPPTRECTYQDFMKCKPRYFKGTEGVNSHVKTVGPDVAYAMTWTNLKKKMTNKYYPKGKIKKLEVKLWNLKVKGTDVVSYNQHFQELPLMCARMFPKESNNIERYIDGLPDMIYRSVMASKPKTMQDAIGFTTELMDKKFSTFVERQAKNKRKFEETSKNNKNQQQNKKQNTDRAYNTGPGDKKPYGGSKPLCSKCNYHHDGQRAPKCHKCNRVGHLARDCRSTTNANTANNQRGTRAGQKPTCFECGTHGHFK
nr:hypothetical protein [Tanacetum cinerariifolium]